MNNNSTSDPLSNGAMKILLLENISLEATQILQSQGWDVVNHPRSLSESELIEKLNQGQFTALGIRSKTRVTQSVIDKNPQLRAIGCFCIGTNQVDLTYAASKGVIVFNSPFANSRSVAELVIGEIIALSRKFTQCTLEMRQSEWRKASDGCFEVRGKTIGIVGYGHIGSQVSVLAEAMGMSVVYFDVLTIMPLGSARQFDSLQKVLEISDFVTLHVPELPETRNMISASQLSQMKKGSILINNSRGSVVDIPALVQALKSGHLSGAAIDVYPSEPPSNGKDLFTDSLNSWTSDLIASSKNLILTPHIGGSTEEAQRMIGVEVAQSLIRYLRHGSSQGSVNFPQVDLRPIVSTENLIRICYVHRNVPGVLKTINEILGNFNVEKQFSESKGDIAYLMADISSVGKKDITGIFEAVTRTPSHIVTRVLH